MSYKAVLFDMDGVLLDSEPLHYLAAKETFASKGHELTHDHYQRYFAGQADKDALKQYCAMLGEATPLSALIAEKAATYLRVVETRPLTPCPGAIECVQALAAVGIPLALVTGSWRTEARLVLESFRLETSFAHVIAAEDTTIGKPDPQGYLMGATALGVSPADCLVIEDAPSGIRAARAAGMRPVAVTTTYAPRYLREAELIFEQLYPGCLDAL